MGLAPDFEREDEAESDLSLLGELGVRQPACLAEFAHHFGQRLVRHGAQHHLPVFCRAQAELVKHLMG